MVCIVVVMYMVTADRNTAAISNGMGILRMKEIGPIKKWFI
jgi:hypothetical protein